MLDFCPYDFEKIDFDNLAYELVFTKGWNWQRVRKETVVGPDRFSYISENDQRRNEHFKKQTGTELVIVRENPRKGGESGFSIFKKYLDSKREERNRNPSSKMEESPFELDEEDMVQEMAWEFEDSDDVRALHYQSRNGKEFFADDHGNIIMYAIPCCPHCHNRLPLGWQTAEDFSAVALLAPSGGGKTTFLYSMMNQNWKAFSELSNQMNDIGKIRVTTAHFLNDKSDTVYAQMSERAAKMCRAGGSCPDNTDREHWIPPVFVQVEYEGHRMILGIYDNAGENLRNMDLIENPNLKMLLDQMIAQMVMFDPSDMNLPLDNQDSEEVLMTLKEQGDYQKRHHKRISGAQLLKKSRSQTGEKEPERLFEVYDNYLSALIQNNCQDRLKQMQFHGILMKSDLLEEVQAIRENAAYDILFDRKIQHDFTDLHAIATRSELVEELIREQKLFGSRKTDDFRADFGEMDEKGNQTGHQAVTWHCISALGSAPVQRTEHGYEIKIYDPIRVAEPLAACILKRIMKNGWI